MSNSAVQRPSAPDDTALVEAARTGDLHAFEELVDRYRVLVFSIAYALTGSATEAEEAAQETFVTAWTDLPNLRRSDRFRSWLSGIARHRGQRLRERRIHGDEGQSDAPAAGAPSLAQMPSTEPSPLDQVITKEEETVVQRALQAIPETYRVPLVLFYQEQQSMETIAKALELNVENVWQRISRGRKMVHQEFLAPVERALRGTRLRKGFTVAVIALLGSGARPASAESDRRIGGKGRAAPSLWIAGTVGASLLLVIAVRVGVFSGTGGTATPRLAARTEAIRKAGVRTSLPSPGAAGVGLAALAGAVQEPRRNPIPNLRPAALDFDFEDGLMPELAIGVAGAAASCPPRVGNSYCLTTAFGAGFLQGGFAGETLFHHTRTMMLAFDYWIGQEARLTVQLSRAAPEQGTFYIHVEHPVAGAWTHFEVPLGQAGQDATGEGFQTGDTIGGLYFVTRYQDGQSLHIDNFKVWQP